MKNKAKRKETYRLKRLCNIEQEIRSLGFHRIAGVDEAGRGPLAGPVVAAACVLPEGYILRGIDDSKKIDFKQRYQHYLDLILQPGVDFAVGIVEAGDIDKLNIHFATLEAMKKAVLKLKTPPSFLLFDGKFTPDCELPSESVVSGDQTVQAIAAASIIAKVTRDHIMLGYHDLYPQYGFKNHMGYGTKEHKEAIDAFGLTPIHRRSFGKLRGSDD